MTFFWIALVHWLHVIGGAVLFGGTVIFAFAVWPLLLRKPAAESRALYEAMAPSVGLTMAIAGNLVIWLGLLRGTWLGPIQSVDMLVRTPYGHTFLTALVLTIIFMAYGGITRKQLNRRVWNGDHYQPGASAFVWRTNLVHVVLLVLILGTMVAMRFGL